MTEPTLALRALRGATTVAANTPAAIAEAVRELMETLVNRNRLGGEQVLTAIFSVTADLDALFPASVARQLPGWGAVALLDCQQMAVVGDLPRCIRVLVQAWLPRPQELCHTYLREAQRLRPDRSSHN
jgi:chorismate mutase